MGDKPLQGLIFGAVLFLAVVLFLAWEAHGRIDEAPVDYATLIERILDDPRIVSNHDRVCLVRGDLIFGNRDQDFGPYTSAICGTVGIVGVDDSNEVPYD